MNQPNLTQKSLLRVCHWCEKSHVSNDSFCSEQCKTKFYSWLETEHAAIRGRRPTYWNMIRRNALERSGNRCEICNDDKNLSVHHIIPLAEGGDSTAQNLRVLCHTCHARIHGRKGTKIARKKKFRFRIRYQPLYIPGILAGNWMWDENFNTGSISQRDNFTIIYQK
jgi:5-methylcytosine-specific restriction enzyme A